MVTGRPASSRPSPPSCGDGTSCFAPTYSFLFAVDTDLSRVVINGLAVSVVLVFAETFRRAVRNAADERDREIERRRMLMAEIEHRTKNNFALVVSMLELQKRKEADPLVTSALEQALARVNSFARAYANLSDRHGEGATVVMRPYMRELVEHMRSAGFPPHVSVILDCDECELPRETAVAIGLFTNEALTNCAKHAFPGMRAGSVVVAFACEGQAWNLSISDDGVGARPGVRTEPVKGLGTRLYAAFAQQAGGRFSTESSNEGQRVILASA